MRLSENAADDRPLSLWTNVALALVWLAIVTVSPMLPPTLTALLATYLCLMGVIFLILRPDRRH